MTSAAKIDAVEIKDEKLTKSMANTQLAFGESRIYVKHFDKITAKCKNEKSLLAALKIEDKRDDKYK